MTSSSAETIAPPSERSFGITFAVVLLIVGLYPLLHGDGLRAWAVAGAVVIAGIALVYPSWLTLPNRAWFRLGLALHAVISPVVFGVLFYLVLTPTGWLMRVLGNDPLRLRLDRSAPTYWISRESSDSHANDMRRQF